MKKVTLAEAKAFWETVKDGKPYCTEVETYSTGGGILATEMPIEYEGMDCLLTLFDEDNLAMCINRRNGFWEDGEETENVILFDIGWNERVPEFLVEYARILMKDKCEYYRTIMRTDYKKYCKENCGQYTIYEDLFEDWNRETQMVIKNRYGDVIQYLEQDEDGSWTIPNGDYPFPCEFEDGDTFTVCKI